MMSKKESGFTLIEIVMVLVLLGILLAVAAPKYFDLQKEARQQATHAIVAEVQSRLNAEFATQLLNDKTCDKAREIAFASVSGGTVENETVNNNQVKAEGAEAGKEPWVVSFTSTTIPATSTVDVNVTWNGESTPIVEAITLPICR